MLATSDFQLGAASIRGHFVSQTTGNPISVSTETCRRLGAEKPSASNVFAAVKCYADGRFEFNNLVGATYKLRSKKAWNDSAATITPIEVQVKPGQILADVAIIVDGESAQNWQFRVLGPNKEFLGGVFLRYQVDRTNNTSNLRVDDNGIATQSIADSVYDIFIEAPGYDSAAVDRTKTSDTIIELHLVKSQPDDEGE